jgi:hypothetical protein
MENSTNGQSRKQAFNLQQERMMTVGKRPLQISSPFDRMESNLVRFGMDVITPPSAQN